jgi:hypothetical protein
MAASNERCLEPGLSMVVIDEAAALRVSTWSMVITGGYPVSTGGRPGVGGFQSPDGTFCTHC